MFTLIKSNSIKALYDGEEKPILENIFTLDNKNYNIQISKFKYINELKNNTNSKDFTTLISEISAAKQSKFFPDNYNGSDGLPLKFNIDEEKNYLLIISYGEFQPGRYKLYLEGVWEISKT